MGRWVTFDHTADLGLKIYATDLADLFRTAAEALFDIIVTNRHQIEPLESEQFHLAADSTDALLLDWLNELIFRCETGHIVFGRFDVNIDPGGRSLTARAHGEPIDAQRHVLDHEVKAATHHGVRLVHDQDGWVAELILDI
jgi:SHS2 domain-containing protein